MKELVAIQSELKAPKNQVNKFGGYNYRSAEDIMEAAKKVLSKYDCFLVVTDDIVMIGERVYVKATATITNSEGVSVSTSAFAREEESKKGMDAAQVTGSASSYARKYALNGLFCIDDTKDPDATNTHGKEDKKEIKSNDLPLDVSGMVLDIMSSNTEEELRDKWKAYQKYDDAEGRIKKAKDVRKKELGL